jgi:hypothetical protein
MQQLTAIYRYERELAAINGIRRYAAVISTAVSSVY